MTTEFGFCANCGTARLAADQKFCAVCGSALSPFAPPAPVQWPTEPVPAPVVAEATAEVVPAPAPAPAFDEAVAAPVPEVEAAIPAPPAPESAAPTDAPAAPPPWATLAAPPPPEPAPPVVEAAPAPVAPPVAPPPAPPAWSVPATDQGAASAPPAPPAWSQPPAAPAYQPAPAPVYQTPPAYQAAPTAPGAPAAARAGFKITPQILLIGVVVLAVIVGAFLYMNQSSGLGSLTFTPSTVSCSKPVAFTTTAHLPSSVKAGDKVTITLDGKPVTTSTVSEVSDMIQQPDGSWTSTSTSDLATMQAMCAEGGTSGGFNILTPGNHTMQVLDSTGKVIASGSYTVTP